MNEQGMGMMSKKNLLNCQITSYLKLVNKKVGYFELYLF
jgi:hypothetical protein